MFVLKELLQKLGIEHSILGDGPTEFEHIGSIDEADPAALVYIRNPNDATAGRIAASAGRLFLVPRAWAGATPDLPGRKDAVVVAVEQPRAVVGALLGVMFPNEDPWPPGVHPTATIHPEAEIGPGASIGPQVTIGKAKIGKDFRCAAFTIIKDNTFIGDRVIIREYCLVGGTGFGFVRNDDGKLERVPHVGRVVIEDDVEIFPYANVDRGTIVETRIKRGAKIDHYAHVSHNTAVGEDTVITAGVVLCGKAKIGDRSWAGIGAIVKQGVVVGSDVTLGMGTVVLADVADGATVAGVPGRVLVKKG